MKLAVLQENLSSALNVVARAVDSRPTLPVLGNVLMIAEDDKLRLYATNYEMAITVTLGAQIDEGGSITLPAKALSDLVSNLAPGRLKLELDEASARMRITSGASKFTLAGIKASEYPAGKDHAAETSVIVPANELARMIGETLYSAESSNIHPVLHGALVVLDETSITLTTADGYRVARTHLALESAVRGSWIVPSDTLREVKSIFKDGDVTIGFVHADNKDRGILFTSGDIEVFAGLVEGRFPDLSAQITDAFSATARLDVDQLKRMLRRARVVVSNTDNYSCTLRFSPSDQMLFAAVSNQERGDGDDGVNGELTGDDLMVKINLTWLMEAIDALGGSMITLGATAWNRPLTISGENGAFGMIWTQEIKEKDPVVAD